MTVDDIRAHMDAGRAFTVEHQGQTFVIAPAEDCIAAWPEGADEEAPSVARLGDIDPYTGKANYAEVAANITAWLAGTTTREGTDDRR